MRHYNSTRFVGLPIALAIVCVVVAAWLIYYKHTCEHNTIQQHNGHAINTGAVGPIPQHTGTVPIVTKAYSPVPGSGLYVSGDNKSYIPQSMINKKYIPQNKKYIPQSMINKTYAGEFNNKLKLYTQPAVVQQHDRSEPLTQLAMPFSVTTNHTERVKKFTLCSINRDVAVYPTASYYKLQLPILLRNVIGVSIHSAVIPRSEYNVNVYAQHVDIYIPFTGNMYAIKLPVGTYNNHGVAPTDFAIALTDAISSTPELSTYTVTYNALLKKLQIQSNAPNSFQLLFKTGPNNSTSMAAQMGFLREEDTLPDVSVTSPYVTNLVGTTAIELYIDEVLLAVENEPVASIILEPNEPYTVFNSALKERQQFWPIGKLAFITFRFLVNTAVMTNGSTQRLYDFNGMENIICLEFKYLQYKNVIEDEIELDPSN